MFGVCYNCESGNDWIATRAASQWRQVSACLLKPSVVWCFVVSPLGCIIRWMSAARATSEMSFWNVDNSSKVTCTRCRGYSLVKSVHLARFSYYSWLKLQIFRCQSFSNLHFSTFEFFPYLQESAPFKGMCIQKLCTCHLTECDWLIFHTPTWLLQKENHYEKLKFPTQPVFGLTMTVTHEDAPTTTITLATIVIIEQLPLAMSWHLLISFYR